MTRIGITELRSRASRIVRDVHEEKAEYVITRQGQPVAVLQPYTEHVTAEERRSETEDPLAAMKEAAREVARAWVSPKSAVELVAEQRR